MVEKREVEKSNYIDYKNLVWFLALFGFVVIRFIGLGEIPGGINQDEAMSAVDALALSMYGTDRFGTFLPAHFTAWGYGQMSVLMAYFTVPFIKLLGFNTFVVRLPMLIASVAGATAVYFYSKNMLGERIAFIIFLFTAINPWHFMQSRWALDCNMFPHMFVIGICLLGMIFKNKKYLYFSMIFFALCMYSYGVAFYMVPVFLLVTCFFLLKCKRVTIRQSLTAFLIYFGISFPIYGTMLINFMKWETIKLPFVTMPYFENSIRANDIIFFCENPIRQLQSNASALIKTAFLQTPDLIWNAIDGFGTMYLCSLPFIVLGLIIVARSAFREKEEKKRILSCILLIYWVCCLITGLCINSVNVNRINIIFYSHIIFAGVGISFIITKWRKGIILIAGVYAIYSALFFNRYFTVWNEEMKDCFYEDFTEAVKYAGEQGFDYYYITPDTQYSGAVKVTEILTLYTLKVDAKYYQGETNLFMGKDISYADRFHYENVPCDNLNYWDNAVYVFKTENTANYDKGLFKVKCFGDYSIAVPVQNAEF